MKEPRNKVIVLGAGPAGLASAFFYLEKGFQVTVIEKSGEVGGLSRGVSFLGRTYDLGPHSFFGNYSDETKAFFERFIGKDDYSKIPLTKGIQTETASFYVPFKLSCAFNWKNLRFFSAFAFSKLSAKLTKSTNDSVVDRQGVFWRRTLYDPFCQKYFNLSSNTVSEQFSSKLFLNAKGKDGATLYVPHAGYVGVLWEKVYEYLSENGVQFEFNQQVEKIQMDGSRIASVQTKNGAFEIDVLVSTIPLSFIHQLVMPNSTLNNTLNYRATVLVYLEVETIRTKALYLTNYDVNCSVGRVTFCSNWTENTSENVVIVEFWCDAEDDFFAALDGAIVDEAVGFLSRLKYVDLKANPRTKVVKIPKCFPVLEKGFEQDLERISTELDAISNLNLSGRHGKFQWDGIDDIIYAAHHE